MCAGFKLTKKQDEKKCQVVGYGDSGGPLQCLDEGSQQWAILGVSSWGEKCHDDKWTPAVYANARYYNQFVKDSFRQHSVVLAGPTSTTSADMSSSASNVTGKA